MMKRETDLLHKQFMKDSLVQDGCVEVDLKSTDGKCVAVYDRGLLSQKLIERFQNCGNPSDSVVLFRMPTDRLYSTGALSYAALRTAIVQGKIHALIVPDMDKRVRLLLENLYELGPIPIYYASLNQIRGSKKITLKRVSRDRPWLDVMEYHAANHCNMNCKGCGHCANLIQEEQFPTLKEYERDLRRLAELFDGVGLIRILGGEPLLNPKLLDFLKLTRLFFPFSNLHIVTNGILLRKMTEELIQFLREESIIIDISLYPPMYEQEAQIRSWLYTCNLLFTVEKIDTFYRKFIPCGGNDAQKSFAHCDSSRNHLMYLGKIASCAMPFSVEILNAQYGYAITHDAWIDFFDRKLDGWEINKRLDSPSSLCSYCHAELERFRWEQRSTQDACEADWIFRSQSREE